MNDVKATKVNINVSEAISNLKALQRQAKESVHSLKEVESHTNTAYAEAIGFLEDLSNFLSDGAIPDLNSVEEAINLFLDKHNKIYGHED